MVMNRTSGIPREVLGRVLPEHNAKWWYPFNRLPAGRIRLAQMMMVVMAALRTQPGPRFGNCVVRVCEHLSAPWPEIIETQRG